MHDLGVRNGSGAWTPGLGFTATITGPARFDATGGATLDGVTERGPLTLHWTATGTGAVTVAVAYRDVPRVTLTRVHGAGNVQTVVTYGHRDETVDASLVRAPVVTFEVAGQFQPVATTAVGSRLVGTGDTLVDTVTVGAAAGDSWLAVQGQPVPVTATPPAVRRSSGSSSTAGVSIASCPSATSWATATAELEPPENMITPSRSIMRRAAARAASGSAPGRTRCWPASTSPTWSCPTRPRSPPRR